ncbi:MAG: Unknown protein [uncultured Campylobacterales bacterium]|uniref:Periplasmic protein n=1 Tax=uncultured Campylobacterales bacterium TaxID=352960 RepID=A0A6S6TKC5_9BACT|nr:MAG: Unknown protein [uncultured Campylobacterales bacterium]
MKKLFCLLFLSVICLAEQRKLSNILSPDINIVSLGIDDCDKSCLLDLLKKGKYFTFLEKYSYYEELDVYYKKLTTHLKIKKLEFMVDSLIEDNIEVNKDVFKLAILAPTKLIKHYTNSIYNSISAYLITKNIDYEIKIFDTFDANFQNIQREINKIEEEGFSYIIAPFRGNVIPILNQNSNKAFVYMPTASIDGNMSLSPNFTLGGISYDEHIDMVVKNLNSRSILLNDPSSKGSYIEGKLKEKFDFKKSITINKTASNLDYVTRRNIRSFERASFVLNTPLVKSSSIISKLKFYDINSTRIYSIQTLYNPNIFELLQAKDLYNIRITNSIQEFKSKNLMGISKLLNNDIKFNWVNYSSLIGVDYFYSKFSGEERDFDEEIVDNKVKYNTGMYRIRKKDFLKLAP